MFSGSSPSTVKLACENFHLQMAPKLHSRAGSIQMCSTAKKATEGLQPNTEPCHSIRNDKDPHCPERADTPTTTASSSSGIGEPPREPSLTEWLRGDPQSWGQAHRTSVCSFHPEVQMKSTSESCQTVGHDGEKTCDFFSGPGDYFITILNRQSDT